MKFRSLITACSFVLVMVLLSSCGVGDDSGKASPFKEVTSSTLGPSHGKPPVPTSGFDGKQFRWVSSHLCRVSQVSSVKQLRMDRKRIGIQKIPEEV